MFLLLDLKVFDGMKMKGWMNKDFMMFLVGSIELSAEKYKNVDFFPDNGVNVAHHEKKNRSTFDCVEKPEWTQTIDCQWSAPDWENIQHQRVREA